MIKQPKIQEMRDYIASCYPGDWWKAKAQKISLRKVYVLYDKLKKREEKE